MESKRVFRVELKDQTVDGKSEFFFGSIAAMYQRLTPEILGVAKSTMNTYLWRFGGQYENKLCKITSGEIIRKSQKKITR